LNFVYVPGKTLEYATIAVTLAKRKNNKEHGENAQPRSRSCIAGTGTN
jgi:hypothetical protein